MLQEKNHFVQDQEVGRVKEDLLLVRGGVAKLKKTPIKESFLDNVINLGGPVLIVAGSPES